MSQAQAEDFLTNGDRTMTSAEFDRLWKSTDEGYRQGLLEDISPLACDRVDDKMRCEHTFMYGMTVYRLITESPMYGHGKKRMFTQICQDHNYCFAKDILY
jgi:hypothetical protein